MTTSKDMSIRIWSFEQNKESLKQRNSYKFNGIPRVGLFTNDNSKVLVGGDFKTINLFSITPFRQVH